MAIGKRKQQIMRYPGIWTIQVFRAEPNDLPIKDACVSEQEGLIKAERTTADRLKGFFQNTKVSREKPTRAYLVDEDGSILSEFRMMPHGVEKVNREKPS